MGFGKWFKGAVVTGLLGGANANAQENVALHMPHNEKAMHDTQYQGDEAAYDKLFSELGIRELFKPQGDAAKKSKEFVNISKNYDYIVKRLKTLRVPKHTQIQLKGPYLAFCGLHLEGVVLNKTGKDQKPILLKDCFLRQAQGDASLLISGGDASGPDFPFGKILGK